MKIHLMLLSSAVFAIGYVKATCNDECGLDKAESSLRVALGVLKLVKDDPDNNSGNSNNTDVTPSPTSNPSVTPSPTSNSSPTSYPIDVSTNGVSTEIHPIEPTSKPINEGCDQTYESLPATCADVLVAGHYKSGIYTIYPRWKKDPTGVKVYCDQTTNGGGWTVIQRRTDYVPRQSFQQTFETYAKGFGNLTQEFWLGNRLIHNLTIQEKMIMRVDMENWEGESRFAHYQGFRIDGEDKLFQLNYENYFDSTAGGDCFERNQGNAIKPFITLDKDPTSYRLASTIDYGKGGLWTANIKFDLVYNNLNGIYYLKGQHVSKRDGIFWFTFGSYNSLKKFEMKLRPKYFTPPPKD